MDTAAEVSMLDIKSYFEERMAKFEAELNKKSPSSTGNLTQEFTAFKSFIMNTLQSFSEQIQSLAREVDKLETRSRRNILLIHGVEEKKAEETGQVVVNFVKQRLKQDGFSLEDIVRCHRMGRQGSSQKPRPIVVKFTTTAVRDSLWFSKTKLKGTGVTLSEFLTRPRHKAFMAAREKFGVNKCWTKEGSVFILSPNGDRFKITSLGDLANIKWSDTEKPPPAKTMAPKPRRAAVSKK